MIFLYQMKKNFIIKGDKFDAKFSKNFNTKIKKYNFKNLNNDIEIDFKNISAPLSEKIKNFKLIGKLKWKFVKISSKGDFW